MFKKIMWGRETYINQIIKNIKSKMQKTRAIIKIAAKLVKNRFMKVLFKK